MCVIVLLGMSVKVMRKFLKWTDKNIVVLWSDKSGKKYRGKIGDCQFMNEEGETPMELMERIIEWNRVESEVKNEYIFHFWNRVVETRIGPVMMEVDERGMSPSEVLESFKKETTEGSTWAGRCYYYSP